MKNWDYEDFTDKTFLGEEIPAKIIGTQFSQNPVKGPTKIFDDHVICEFENCGFGNVIKPAGCTFTGTTEQTHKFFKQVGNEIWVITENGVLIEVFNG